MHIKVNTLSQARWHVPGILWEAMNVKASMVRLTHACNPSIYLLTQVQVFKASLRATQQVEASFGY